MLDFGESRTSNEEALSAVVSAAREAFARYGIHRTRMEDIAAAAGIPRQYLYRYVASKEQLFELALLERCREFSDEILKRTRVSTKSPEQALVNAVVACVVAGRDDTEFAYLAEALSRTRLNVILSGSGSPMHTYVKRCLGPTLERARSAGRLRTDATDDAIVDWLQGQMTWLTPRDDLDEAALKKLLLTFVVPSLFQPDGIDR
ncbi:TetR/AcrR family transcriptional regulator [Mycobacterium sp.]|uniref:TetR/AcrR family transcriptional regulator n=1 Tax=Mycobacterium sp. TaxID=1785 RepID=UPI00122966FA|nr:TetR/AcrR family transcriptional regulator [Mycobacterium sp.]TAM69849.1 MAG: TetR/AcrR family transcriptional regulator [Mycobacterium sp.]